MSGNERRSRFMKRTFSTSVGGVIGTIWRRAGGCWAIIVCDVDERRRRMKGGQGIVDHRSSAHSGPHTESSTKKYLSVCRASKYRKSRRNGSGNVAAKAPIATEEDERGF